MKFFRSGIFRAGVLLTVYVIPIVLFSLANNPAWGPIMGLAFGCFAFSVAVQQAYAFGTQTKQRNEQFVYLWSSASLFAFGIGTVLACLPNIDQIGMSSDYVRRGFFIASTILLAFGFIALFRFSASYLYRGTKDMLSVSRAVGFPTDNIRTVFKRNKLSWQYITELVHLLFCGIVGMTAFISLLDDAPLPALDVTKPIYFPFPISKFALCTAGIATAACSFLFFQSKYQQIKHGIEELEGIRFMTSMGILFFIPSIIQVTALGLSDVGWTPRVVAGFWAGALVLLALAVWVISGEEAQFPEDEEGKKRSASAAQAVMSIKNVTVFSLAICAGVSLSLCLYRPLLDLIPLGFITLGFLTLASAYLPIDDWERSRPQQKPLASVDA